MPRRRSRPLALLGLALYAAGTFALPALHLHDHRPDHRHAPDGSIVTLPRSADEEHHAFDADLIALDLADAGHFGVTRVDCTYAAYTLASCEDDGAAPPHGFGDELIARTSHHHAPAVPDGDHGRGSALHFGLAYLAGPPFLLPPPAIRVDRLRPLPAAERAGHPLAARLRARAPPAPPIA